VKIKRVEKPWGHEEWLALNEFYCYKRIHINAGTRTSFQYHEYKHETNYIISGSAEVWLENSDGIIEKKVMSAGDYFDVSPPKKHRVIAITDVILQEVSTPHVDDVIRIEDDAHREDGRIESEHINPAMCILAAGFGKRLEELTRNINKALLPVRDKAIISYIIDLTPKAFDIVVALGYTGELVRSYLEVAHPDRNFIFVDVDNIDGYGSGPGYSLSACSEFLQRPFYFVTADCLVDDLPRLDKNWLGVFKTGIPELYSTVDFDNDNNITQFVNKSSSGFNHAFIGLAGIKDYEIFWHELDKNMKSSGEVVSAFYNIKAYEDFKAYELNWTDTGTIDNYIKVRDNKHSLPKTTGECLYRLKDTCHSCGKENNARCVKIFPQDISNKIKRISHLKMFLPNVKSNGSHVISYNWVSGKTLYEVDEIDVYKSFVRWAHKNLWKPVECKNFKELCDKFYRQKTNNRISHYLEKRQEINHVNGKYCGTIYECLNRIDWDRLSHIPTSLFHGDLQFDNIIYNKNKGFTMIDWRDDFGGSADYGDVYYDLAKLYGGTLINYREMRSNLNAKVSISDNNISLTLNDNSNNLVELRNSAWLDSWIESSGFDLNTVKILTALIFLNMSPLHESPFSEYLFYRGKEMLHDHYR
tara:strand:+ start:190 stop:2115 length:1926 start_codon:yes stop_codon:yes gene_type:complete